MFEEGEIIEEHNNKMIESYVEIFKKASEMTESYSIHTYFDLGEQMASSFSTLVAFQTKLNLLQSLINNDPDDAYEKAKVIINEITDICNRVNL